MMGASFSLKSPHYSPDLSTAINQLIGKISWKEDKADRKDARDSGFVQEIEPVVSFRFVSFVGHIIYTTIPCVRKICGALARPLDGSVLFPILDLGRLYHDSHLVAIHSDRGTAVYSRFGSFDQGPCFLLNQSHI